MTDATHWAARRERGAYVLMWLTFQAVRRLGRRPLAPLIYLIVLYFFLFGRAARHSAREYQERLAATVPGVIRPSWYQVYRQFLAFAESLLDKLAAWTGQLTRAQLEADDQPAIERLMASGQGVLLIGSHWGNIEVCRAMASSSRRVRLNVLVHTRHAAQFNRLLGQAGASPVELIQVTELGPATAMMLSERLAAGEWVVIAGDRLPVNGGRAVAVDFLGGQAWLPQGPYLLAGLLQCPVYLLFCWRDGARFRLVLEPFRAAIRWRRDTRAAVMAHMAQAYADRLAHYCQRAPLQWFNFFPFWQEPGQRGHGG